MMQACEAAGQSYGAVPIAASPEPGNTHNIICWADGHVDKSPPPAMNGSVPPDFDRLVYSASAGGDFVAFIMAGYRSQLKVTPP